MKRYLLRRRFIVIAAVCVLASLALFWLGVIQLWLDVLDPPDNPLPDYVIFVQRFADFFLLRALPGSIVLYASTAYAALLGVLAAVVADTAVSFAQIFLRRATI